MSDSKSKPLSDENYNVMMKPRNTIENDTGVYMAKQELTERVTVRIDRRKLDVLAKYKGTDISGTLRKLVARAYARLPKEARIEE